MTRWQPRREHVMSELATEILGLYGRGRAVVGVDGRDGAGKTRFAADLAEAVRATGHAGVTASLDDFHRPRAARYARGRDSAEGYYRDAFDLDAVRSALIVPFRSGQAFRTAAFDLAADRPVAPPLVEAPAAALLIVEGMFLHRRELVGMWNYSIWLTVRQDVAESRLLARDGPSSVADRYRGAQELYRREVRPSSAATAIIDNDDPEHPRRVFADSC